MSGHRPFSALVADFTPARLARIAEAKARALVWGEARITESCGCVWCDLDVTKAHPCRIAGDA